MWTSREIWLKVSPWNSFDRGYLNEYENPSVSYQKKNSISMDIEMKVLNRKVVCLRNKTNHGDKFITNFIIFNQNHLFRFNS